MREYGSTQTFVAQPSVVTRGSAGQDGDNGPGRLAQGRLMVEVQEDETIYWLGTALIPAMTERFIARDNFREDSRKVNLYKMWGNFYNWFLAGDSKIEEPRGTRLVRYGNFIRKPLMDMPISGSIDEAKAEVTLSEIWEFLKKQPCGEGGESFLLVGGCVNTFRVRDIFGILRTVQLSWYVGGWRVMAYSVGCYDRRPAVSRVFSRGF